MTTTETTYAIDPSHSSAEFVVRHMMIAKVRGRFTTIAGTIVVAGGANVPSSIAATLGVASIATGEPQRDGHLVSPDFFDVATYPTIEFKSTKITADGDGFTAEGDLTMHGVTKAITLEATYEGRVTDPYGNARIGFDATTKINRSDFDLKFNIPLAEGVAIGEEVKLEFAIEAIAQA